MLERFKPTTGLVIGWAGVAIAVFTVVYVALQVHTVVGLRIGLGAVFAAVLVWSTQLRPRVTAYTSSLLLKGSVRDARVPYVLIDEVTMGQTLNVWVGDQRFVCIGIGKSLGSDIRQRAEGEPGVAARQEPHPRLLREGGPGRPGPDRDELPHVRGDPHRGARRPGQARPKLAGRSADGAVVRRPYAVPEIVAMTVAGVAFVASLFL